MIRESMLSACNHSDTLHRFDNSNDNGNVDNIDDDNGNDDDDDDDDDNVNNDVKVSENIDNDIAFNNIENKNIKNNKNNNIDLSTKKQRVNNSFSVILKTILLLLRNEYNKIMMKKTNGPENVPGIIQVTHVLPQKIPDSSEIPLKNVLKKIKSARTFRVVIVADDDNSEERPAPFMDDGDDDFIPKKRPRISKK